MSRRPPVPRTQNLPEDQQWDGAEGPRAETPEQGADLGDFLRIIAARPLAVLLPLALTSGLAMAYLTVTRPTFNSSTSILIDARVKPSLASDAGPAVGFPDVALVESQVKLIASDVVLRRVVLAEKLIEDPEFIIGAPGIRDRLLSLIGFGGGAPQGDPLPNALSTLARAVTVKRSERTYVMDVEVALGDPQKAARVANAIAKAYIVDQQDTRSDASKRDSDSLRIRLEDLQARVQDADTKVEAYKSQNKISDANGKLLNDQQLLEVTTALGAAHARASEVKARLDQIQRLAKSGKLPEATADAVKSVTLDKLRAQFAEISRQEANFSATLGERHPAMIEVANQLRQVRRLIADELKRIADTAANEYQTAHSAELGLERQSDALKKSGGAQSQTMVQLRELQREADAQRSVYEKFLRTRETIKTDGEEQPIARVIAPAMANTVPSAPRRAAILSLAFVGGLALGLANAMLMHAWRGSERRPRRVPAAAAVVARGPRNWLWWRNKTLAASPVQAGPEPSVADTAEPDTPGDPLRRVAARPPVSARRGRAITDVPQVIATLPFLAPRQAGSTSRRRSLPPVNPMMAVRDLPDSAFAAAVLHVLDHLRARPGEGEPQTVFVTAREEESGVSVLAAGLAFAAAAQGERVLLIEANGAHPRLSELVPAGALATPIRLKGVQRSAFLLETLGSGELLVVPMEDSEADVPLAATARMTRRRIAGIKNNFDFVVIDGAVLEDDAAVMMASAATDVLMVEASPDTDETVSAICAELNVPVEKFAGLVRVTLDEAEGAAQPAPQRGRQAAGLDA